MKNSSLLIMLIHFYFLSFSQENKMLLSLRMPIQIDNQSATLYYSWGSETKRGTALNFGADILLSYQFQHFSFSAGAGVFKNKFNIIRGYDHHALNIGVDSFPVGTFTENYVYSLLRFPIGIQYKWRQYNNTALGIGIEQYFNFSFRRKYNGALPPIENPNTTYKGFTYFGNSTHFTISISKKIYKKTLISIEPFVRVFNTYKKDRFLLEDEEESNVRSFDSFGLNFIYSFTL